MVFERKFERMLLVYYLRVINRETDQVIGHAVDISKEGIMVFGNDPVKTDSLFQLQILLPEEIQGSRSFEFFAMSQWCKQLEDSELFNIGFQFKDLSKEGLKVIEHLIDEFCF